jgi:hypothetical protein
MKIGLWLAAAIGVGVAAMCGYRWWIYRLTDQFVKLTERRHAELLDVQRRQQEDG